MNNESIESVTTTAGLAGFIVLFSLAIVCWLLFRGMNKRLRNIRLREEQEAAARQDASADSGSAADTGDAGDPEPDR